MRPIKDRLALALLGIIVVAGCDNKPGGNSTSATSGEATTTVGVASAQSPRQAGEAILKELGEGKVTPAQLTDGFKKKLAPPKKDVDAVATEWLTLFKGGEFRIGEEAKVGDANVFRGLAKFPNQSTAFTLRLKKDPNGYKVDWLDRSERQGSEIKSPADPELAVAQDSVRNFLDVLLGGDLRQAHALMAPAWKKSLSPPAADDTRDGYDFGPGFLTGVTRKWKGDYNGYTLSTGEMSPNKEAATFVATMNSGSEKTQYLVKATKDLTGEWLVSDYEKQQ
jgi:hypothetical protein